MTRREFLTVAASFTATSMAAFACARSDGPGASPLAASESAGPEASAVAGGVPRLEKLPEQWRELLPADRYRVLFKAGTEPPFSSKLNNEKRDGTFICAACNFTLFESATKFDSGTGWPSFWAPIDDHTESSTDYKLIYPRTEYHCARCGGHQGHVFKDGPKPTGQRWCNNGLALLFVPRDETLPELRS